MHNNPKAMKRKLTTIEVLGIVSVVGLFTDYFGGVILLWILYAFTVQPFPLPLLIPLFAVTILVETELKIYPDDQV